MARLLLKLGVSGSMVVSGLFAISCGGPAGDGDTAESRQLNEKKSWRDITSFLGRWNGNRKCGGNKDEPKCVTGEESGGLRFEGNRSGCEWRGDKCQVSCGRIADDSLCGRSDECEWDKNEQKCYLDQAIDGSEEKIKYTDMQLQNDFIGDSNFLLAVTTYCHINNTVRKNRCLVGSCIVRKGKCRAACARIVTKTLCGTIGVTGCTWKNNDECVFPIDEQAAPIR
ncbi:MAG: hypothetical protein AAF471_03960 [Myxococcota bacterium]